MGPRQSAGKNVSAPTMTITLTSRPAEQRPVGGERAGAGGHDLLAHHASRRCASDRDDHEEATEEHRDAASVTL